MSYFALLRQITSNKTFEGRVLKVGSENFKNSVIDLEANALLESHGEYWSEKFKLRIRFIYNQPNLIELV